MLPIMRVLQTVGFAFVQAMTSVSDLLAALRSSRTEMEITKIFEEATLVAKLQCIELRKPLIASRPVYRPCVQ